MYMAPEVFRAEPYADTADVFSFGVVMYELFTRTLLVFTQIATHVVDTEAPERYARKVAGGYRPPRAACIDDETWELISRCWAQDPVERPSMASVVVTLEGMRERMQLRDSMASATCGCAIS